MNNRDYQLKIILLAAGKSERFNDIKLLAKVAQHNSSITVIEHVLQQISLTLNTLAINESRLHVATGGYHAQLRGFIDKKFSVHYCDDAHCGLGHTIAQTVEGILSSDNQSDDINGDATSHIMITLADQVALNSDDYLRLIKQSLATPNKIVCAIAAQELMPPAIFPQRYFADLGRLTGDKGAKVLLHKNKKNLQQIDLPNAAIDIDTQQDLIHWQKIFVLKNSTV